MIKGNNQIQKIISLIMFFCIYTQPVKSVGGEEEYQKALEYSNPRFEYLIHSYYFFLDIAARKGHEKACIHLINAARTHFIFRDLTVNTFHKSEVTNSAIINLVEPFYLNINNMANMPSCIYKLLQKYVKEGDEDAYKIMKSLAQSSSNFDQDFLFGGTIEEDTIIREFLIKFRNPNISRE